MIKNCLRSLNLSPNSYDTSTCMHVWHASYVDRMTIYSYSKSPDQHSVMFTVT